MTPKKATIHDIARKLNLTASTVSRALNDHPNISKATKKLVLQMSQELNYKPNTIAASLRKGKAKTIGLVVPRINRNFISNAIFGIEKVTNEFGYNLIICQSEESLEKEIRNLKTLVNSRVDGILISVSLQTNISRHILAILHDNIPLIQFDRYMPEIDTGMVLNDNYQISYDAVKYLINKGCKKILHFGGPDSISIYNERRKGYKQALEDSGLEVDNDSIEQKILLKEEGYCKAFDVLKSRNIPDAIFAASDYSALGALLAAKEIGIDIPKKLSIIGYANEPYTEFVTPSITSIEQYGAEMGATAARMLLNKIGENMDESFPDTIIIKSKLILRNSV